MAVWYITKLVVEQSCPMTAQDAQVLVLGYLVDPHSEAFGDGDLVLLLCWLGSWLTWLGSQVADIITLRVVASLRDRLRSCGLQSLG